MKETIKTVCVGFIVITLFLLIAYYVGDFVCESELFGTMRLLSNPELIMFGTLSLMLLACIISLIYLIGALFLLLVLKEKS